MLDLLKTYCEHNGIEFDQDIDLVDLYHLVDKHHVLTNYFKNCEQNEFNDEIYNEFLTNNEIKKKINSEEIEKAIKKLPIPSNCFKSRKQIIDALGLTQ